MAWAVFIRTVCVIRFPHRAQAVTWCLENGYVQDVAADFPGDLAGRHLADGVEIREVSG